MKQLILRWSFRTAAISTMLIPACSPGQSANDLANTNGSANGASGSASLSVASGTVIDAALTDAISSRSAKAGDAFFADVVEDVMGVGGGIAIPAGSTVKGSIVEVTAAPNSNEPGTLTLVVSSVVVHGHMIDLNASIDSLETTHQGRGIEAVTAARVAGGAAAGAILGRVIGGNEAGTIIGGMAGAVAGGAVSAKMNDRDIVLPAGAHLILTLRESLTVTAE